jgi:hypothetical protein
VDTGRSQLVLKGPPAAVVHMSGDGRTLLIEREALEGDLWLMEFRR